MDSSNVINLGLLILTGLGVVVTAWQAQGARAARAGAEQSSAAVARIAEELAHANARALQVKWEIRRSESGEFIVTNVGAAVAWDAELSGLGNYAGAVSWTPPRNRAIAPTESLAFSLDLRLGMSKPDIEITWVAEQYDDARTGVRLTLP